MLIASCAADHLVPYQATLLDIADTTGIDVPTYVPQQATYTGYKINNFDVVINPDRPNELLIYRSGKIVSLINDDLVRIYYPNAANLPLSEHEMFSYNSKSQSATYNTSNTYYSDHGFDGIDMESAKITYDHSQPDYFYSEFAGKPRIQITKAHVDNKVCKPFVENIACCLADHGRYVPYKFTNSEGWQNISDNDKMNLNCNHTDFDTLRSQLNSELYR